MLFRLFMLCVVLLSIERAVLADLGSYEGKPTITVADAKYSVVHYHDWSQRDALWKIVELPRRESVRIFDRKHNGFSYIKVFDKASGALMLRLPVPALTVLWLSPDSRYLVGLSDVMLWNPYQLVVYALPSGKRLYAEPIAPNVYSFTPSEYADFVQRFPAIKTTLKERSRTFDATGDRIIVNVVFGLRNEIPDKTSWAVWKVLYPHRTHHPYSPNFGSSVTNWVNWYDEKNPGIALAEQGKELMLSLNDPRQERFVIRIPLNEGTARRL